MSKRPTAIHLDRLAFVMSRLGYKPKRHELLEMAAAAFGYRNSGEFTAAKVQAAQAIPIGTIQILGSTIVLARDAINDAVFAIEESFLEQVSADTPLETYVPTPYGHLSDISRLLDEPLPKLDQPKLLNAAEAQQAEKEYVGFVIEAIDNDERLYWNSKDGWVNLQGATRFPDKKGTMPSVGLDPVWRTVEEARHLQSRTESWAGVKTYQLAKKIVADLLGEVEPAIATFTPQVWVQDNAMGVDPEGEDTYEVTVDLVAYALQEGADTVEEYLDGSDKDDLQTADNAPQWVWDWSGPFYIEIDACIDILMLNLNEAKKKVEAS